MTNEKESDLDFLLDEALDDFDTQSTSKTIPTQPHNTITEVFTKTFPSSLKSSQKAITQKNTLINEKISVNDAELYLEVKLSEYSKQNHQDEEKEEELKNMQLIWDTLLQKAEELEQSKINENENNSVTEFERSISNTARLVSQSAQRLEDESGSGSVSLADDEDLLSNSFSKLFLNGQQNGNESNFDGMVEKMVYQMMEKNVMYDPLKDVSLKYSDWFESNKNSNEIKKSKMENYRRQYELINKLLNIYETTPNDFDKIIPLIDEISNCGPPPNGLIVDGFNNNIILSSTNNCPVM
eukprot:c3489_g1_i1.p1 GENE.c3489_g1_i1~~c3489_g1_i1.p1  ORF type:complete len:297 (-),score=106.16 c3489_g1_i1:60-950(-)